MSKSCKETTKKYKRLPPPQAVPFKGFDFAKIKSREPVARKLEEFLKKSRETKFFTVALIRAEWGEGKTDAYERYIKPQAEKRGDYAYLVSTSTIVNKLSKADILFPIGPPESVTLLTSIFYALKDELRARDEDDSLLPDHQEYKDPLHYIQKVLQNHLSEKTDKRMYLFVDEFEEILIHSSDIQKKILSGIKELINGQLKMVHEGGFFAGQLHVILACTPYAYNIIREDVELAQIFGSFASRISPNLIDLPQINKREAFQFLIDILRFSYEGTLPHPLPIKSSGILNGIYTVSQKSLRALVQLLTDLLSVASLNGELRIIDYEHFLNTLRGKEIGIYGGSTKCVDDELLIKTEAALRNIRDYGKECTSLFRLLVGEYKAFSIEEIRQRLGIIGDQDVHNYVEIINQELKKIGIERAITRLQPLREDKNIEEVIDVLKPVEKEIVLPKSRISIDKFEDETIFFEIDSKGNLLTFMFLPREMEETQRIFDISDDEAEYLQRKLSNYFVPIAQKRHFALSRELTDQLFPSLTWMLIDFVIDRSKRMNLWREAMKNFSDMVSPLRDGMIETLNKSDKFNITLSSDSFNLNYTLSSGIQVALPTAFYTTTTRVNMNDIKNLRELLDREKPSLILLVHVGGIDDDASNELNLMPKVMPIHIKLVRAQQLIVLSLARKRGIEINDKLAESRLREMLYELEFGRKFDSWLEKCRKEGLLIEDLKKAYGESDRSLAQAMTYYTGTIDEEVTLQRVFEEAMKLQSFTLYGTREVSFAPLDIETIEKFSEYHHDLLSNEFLKDRGKGKVQVTFNPIEQKIVGAIGKTRISIRELKRKFIVFAQNKGIFEQVYLPILRSKGLIQVGKEEVIRVDKKGIEQRVRKKFKDYSDTITEKRKQPWWSYAHICNSKERADRVIMLDNFDQYLRKLRQKLDTPSITYNDEVSLRLMCLLDILLDHFNATLEPRVSKAWNRGRSIINEALEKKNEIESILDRLLEDYNRFCEKTYARNDVDDYVNLKAYHERLDKVGKKEYSLQDIEKGLDVLATQFRALRKYEGVPRYFYFGRPEEEASYFNYKVYELERTLGAFSKRFEEVKKKCDEILRKRERITNVGNQIKARLFQYAIDKAYKVSFALHDNLVQCQMMPIRAKPLTRLSLDDVKGFFEEFDTALNEFDRKVSTSLTYLNLILSKEKTIILMKDNILRKAENTKKFFETEGKLFSEASAILSEVTRMTSEYDQLVIDVQGLGKTPLNIDQLNERAKGMEANLGEIMSFFNGLEQRLQDLYKESVEVLETYKENVERFLKVLKEARTDVTMLGRAFDATISEAIEGIRKLSLGKEISITWKEIWEDLERIKHKLFNEVKNVLSEDEFNVLFTVVDASTKKEWLDTSGLIQQIVSDFGKSEKEAKDLIDTLINKQLLKPGVSLPI